MVKTMLGAVGEDIAAGYLTAQGWHVLQQNWRCKAGEVDLIAVDPDAVLVFVEVKCRSGLGFGHPLEAITFAKTAKLRQLVSIWLDEQGGHFPDVRIDAIGVLLGRGQRPQITQVKGIG